MDLITLFGITIGIGIIPFDRVLPWCFRHIRRLSSELEDYSDQIFFSKAPIEFLLAHLCHFAKGYLLMTASFLIFPDIVLLFLISLLLVCHVWTPLLKFKNRYNYLMLIWGIYTAIYLPALWIMPIILLLLVTLMNSVTMAVILSSILALPVLWIGTELTVVIPVTVILMLWVFLILQQRVFSHFESTPETLIKAFERR